MSGVLDLNGTLLYAAAVAMAVTPLWMFAVGYCEAWWNPKRQNRLDRASGLVVVRVPPEHNPFFGARKGEAT